MTIRKRVCVLLVVGLAAALALALPGCSSPSAPTPSVTPSGGTSGTTGGGTGEVSVVEASYQFNPSAITAKVGDKVSFANEDAVPHRIVVGTTDLGVQKPGQTVSWTADKNGTFPVKCTIHPSMTGQITVGAGGGSGSSTTPNNGGSKAPAPPSGNGYGY